MSMFTFLSFLARPFPGFFMFAWQLFLFQIAGDFPEDLVCQGSGGQGSEVPPPPWSSPKPP